MKLTKDELKTLAQVLSNTPTQNLETAQVLLTLKQKLEQMASEPEKEEHVSNNK